MNLDDRIAILLGRAIMRAEALQAANKELHARIAELESQPQPSDTEEDLR